MPGPNDPPPSISAAELRRRLLASTPPPMVGATSTALELEAEPRQAPPQNVASDMLNRLRMPGQSTATPAPQHASDNLAPRRPVAEVPTRSSVAADSSADKPQQSPPGKDPVAEAKRLKEENKELRHLLAEMKTLLQEASDAEQTHTTEIKKYEVLLAEKVEQVKSLSAQLQEIENQVANGTLGAATAAPKTRTELEEWSDELEQEAARVSQQKKQFEEERRQLREDEESLEKQMRQMEVSMARERAIMARQETELKRLSAEIQHELELMQRGDATLREQMLKFQRRAQEVLNKPGGPPSGGSGPQGWPRRG